MLGNIYMEFLVGWWIKSTFLSEIWAVLCKKYILQNILLKWYAQQAAPHSNTVVYNEEGSEDVQNDLYIILS